MPATKERTGSRHKPRVMVALLPELGELLSQDADRNRRPARWQAHEILVAHFVAEGLLSQEDAKRLWVKLTRRTHDTDE